MRCFPLSNEVNDNFQLRVYGVSDFNEDGLWAKVKTRRVNPVTDELGKEEYDLIVTLDTPLLLQTFVDTIRSLQYADLFGLDENGFYITLGSDLIGDEESVINTADMSKVN